MQLHHILQATLVTGALSALVLNEPRQVIVTVTAPPTPVGTPSAPSPVPLSAPAVPWEQPPTPVPVPAASSGNLSLPPSPPLHPTVASPPAIGSPVPAPGSGSVGGGAKCGKGYTYCGYMLTGGGHNFAQVDIDRSYCNGLPGLCAGGKHKTNVEQAVFVCMNDQPSNIQLLCACSGTCLNNATSNYIAHCDEPCVNT
ncbi:hypothetical protein F4859DRAFT_520628 [Xylaria cf. heliscus]|nr:hypothetical protein F4859DRAFT_520628 [Xylaria cf. heliscus]